MNSENAKLKTKEEKSLLRLPPGMRDSIAAAAKANKRSMNSELIYRLEASFAVPPDIVEACKTMPELKDRLDFAVRLFQNAGFSIEIPVKKPD